MAEDRYQEIRVKRSVEEEENCLERSFHRTVLLGKLRQVVRQSTNREGGGLLQGDVCTKTGQQVTDVLREEHPDIRVAIRKTPRARP